jgi:hypothetical protein
MATIINNPPSNNSGGPMGMIIVLVILLVLGYLGYAYGLPAIQQIQTGGTEVNVPSQIDVNIKQTE